MNYDLKFNNLLLKAAIKDAADLGITIDKLTVYKYSGFSRNGYHTYQVYSGDKVLGDYSGYYASEAKTKAINDLIQIHTNPIDDNDIDDADVNLGDLNNWSKIDLARVITQALFNASQPLPADHFQVKRQAKQGKAQLVKNAESAIDIISKRKVAAL